MKKITLSVLIFVMAISLTGCGTYYKITDPATGKVYYTDEIDDKKGGAIRFKDSSSRNLVTLQESEVMEITKDEFEANKMKR